MTELEMMARVAVNPLVVKYRQALQSYHKRMEQAYGPDFMDTVEERQNYGTEEDPRGLKIMTDGERDHYHRLMIRLSTARKRVRELYEKK